MFVVQIDFHHPERTFDVDAVECLLAAWVRNGHLVSDPAAVARLSDRVRAIGVAPDQDALAEAQAGPTVRSEIAKVRGLGMEFSVTWVGPSAVGDGCCECRKRTEFLLFAHFLSAASPLRCGTCFGPVPLYRVPAEPGQEHVEVLAWQGNYRACDTLQMYGTVGERFAERQMREVGSALARSGREICASLESRLGAPVYYVLYDPRLRVRPATAPEACPACGGPLRAEERHLGFLDWRCEPCRLLGGASED